MRDGDLDKLEQINEQMRQEMERQEMDSEKVSSLDYKFHTELIKLTRNSLVIRIGETIYTLFFSSISESLRFDENRSYENHKKILEAMRSKDVQDVREAVRESLEHWRQQLER